MRFFQLIIFAWLSACSAWASYPSTVTDYPTQTGGGGSGAVTLIETITLGSDGTIDFENIPQTYKSLHLEFLGRGAASATDVNIRLTISDDITDANYTRQFWYANDTTGGAQGSASDRLIGSCTAATSSANIPCLITTVIHGYADTTFAKVASSTSVDGRTSGSDATIIHTYMARNNTAAVTSLEYSADSGDLASGSTASLWGVQ